jgi:flagellin-specific chaperone FliS
LNESVDLLSEISPGLDAAGSTSENDHCQREILKMFEVINVIEGLYTSLNAEREDLENNNPPLSYYRFS